MNWAHNLIKLNRAISRLPQSATEQEIFEEYKKLGGAYKWEPVQSITEPEELEEIPFEIEPQVEQEPVVEMQKTVKEPKKVAAKKAAKKVSKK